MFLKIIIFHLFSFLLLFSFLFIVVLICFIFFPSTFSDTNVFTSGRALVAEVVPTVKIPMMLSYSPFSAQKYLDSSGRKTERELVEEREQRMKENDTKMMQIKEKEEELKRIEEKFLMALSTAIDKWVEHANDEGWLASYFDVHLFSFIIIINSVSILLSSVSEADVRGFWSR